MPAFSGDLKSVGLSDVLHTLGQNRKEGVLTLSSGSESRRLHVTNAGISLLDARVTGRRRLGEILQRAGLVTERALEDALRQQSKSRAFLGEILVEQGALHPDDLQRILQVQVEEELYDLFRIMDGQFEFIEGDPDEPGIAQMVPFHVDGVVFEAARRLDEWSVIGQKVPDLGCVYVAHPQANAADDDEAAVLAQLDGRHTVQHAADALVTSPFTVAKVLTRLLESGKARETSIEERLAAAEVCVGEGLRSQAAELLLALADELPDTDRVRLLEAARLLRQCQEPERAARLRVRLAEHARRQGDLEEAWNQLREARKDTPHSVDVVTRLAGIAQVQAEPDVELRLRRQEAELHGEAGDAEASVRSFERAFELAPLDVELRRQLVEACLRARLKQRAVELLLQEAEELRRTGRITDLVALYKRVLTIDSRRVDVKKALVKVRRTKAERALRLSAWTIAGLGLLGVAAYFAHDSLQKSQARSELTMAGDQFRRGDFQGARRSVQAVLDGYAYQEIALEASALMDRVDAELHEATRAERAEREAAFDETLNGIEGHLSNQHFDRAFEETLGLLHSRLEPYLRDRAAGRFRHICRRLEDHAAAAIQAADGYVEPTLDRDYPTAYASLSRSFPEDTSGQIERARAILYAAEADLAASERPSLAKAITAIDAWESAYQRVRPSLERLVEHNTHLRELERMSGDFLGATEATDAGDVERAIQLYERVLERYGDGELRPMLATRLTRLREAMDVTAHIETLLKQGETEAANSKALAALDDYIEAGLVTVLRLPVRIDSTPSGANVRINGDLVGVTPFIARVRMGTTVEAVVEREGFEPAQLNLPSEPPLQRSVFLRLETLFETHLSAPSESGATWHGDAFWVSTRDGALHRIDPLQPDRSPRFETGSLTGSRCAPVSTEAGVAHVTADGKVWMIRHERGSLVEVWARDIGGESRWAPWVWNDQLLVATQDKGITSLNVSDGTPTFAGLLKDHRVAGRPMLAGDSLYVPVDGGVLMGLNLAERKTEFKVRVCAELAGHVAVDGEHLIVASTDGRLFSLDPKSGATRWNCDVGGMPSGPLLLHAPYLDVPLADSVTRVHLMRRNIAHAWNIKPQGGIGSFDDVLLVGDQNGDLSTFTERSVRATSTTPLGKSVVGIPLATDDFFAVVCKDGTFLLLLR